MLISILSRHDPSTIFAPSRLENEWLDEYTNLIQLIRFIRALRRVKISRGLEPRVVRLSSPPLRLGDHACNASSTAMRPGYGRALSSEWCMVLFVDHGSPIKRRGSSVLGR